MLVVMVMVMVMVVIGGTGVGVERRACARFEVWRIGRVGGRRRDERDGSDAGGEGEEGGAGGVAHVHYVLAEGVLRTIVSIPRNKPQMSVRKTHLLTPILHPLLPCLLALPKVEEEQCDERSAHAAADAEPDKHIHPHADVHSRVDLASADGVGHAVEGLTSDKHVSIKVGK